jgi:AcrR family transcriptional regulator
VASPRWARRSARGGPVEAGGALQQRALARARGAHHGREGAGREGRGDPGERGHGVVVRLGECFQTDRITIADAEGLTGLSIRRLAGELGIPTMSVYRHIADKEELVLLMMDEVMGGTPPPPLSPVTDGWRACLEALARLQWQMCRRHTWLAQAISFSRPLPAPNAMAHTEWAMVALDAAGFEPAVQLTAAAMAANYVRGTAVNLEEEQQAVQETGMTDADWFEAQHERVAAALAGGRLPMMTRALVGEGVEVNLDILLEFGLQRLLDGLEKMAGPPGE